MPRYPQRIDGALAWKNAVDSPVARWGRSLPRFAQPVFRIAHRPKFAIAADQRFFCIGSCFARNIEEHLIYNGLRVLSRRIRIPAAEWLGRSNGIVNKVTTASMLNEFQWLQQPPAVSSQWFAEQAGGWLDLSLSSGARPVTLARAIERRSYLTQDYFRRMQEADILVLTLGLDEVWFDARTGQSLNAAPPASAVGADPGRYHLEVTGYEQNLAALESIHRLATSMHGGVRLIVTVSPVALNTSFSGVDVVLATSRAKSMLVTVAQGFAGAHDDVDYFPSYEMVMFSPRDRAFARDGRHVTDGTVQEVVGAFLDSYMNLPVNCPAGFTELGYLAANPDVDAAVRSGVLESGYEHWLAHGRAQGRRLMPDSGPTATMIAAGAAAERSDPSGE